MPVRPASILKFRTKTHFIQMKSLIPNYEVSVLLWVLEQCLMFREAGLDPHEQDIKRQFGLGMTGLCLVRTVSDY
jgi:hypothetical protein